MVKYYTRIIHREIKKGLPNDIFYLSILCKPMNYNILLQLFSINMQIQNKKYIWHEFSTISRNNSLGHNLKDVIRTSMVNIQENLIILYTK